MSVALLLGLNALLVALNEVKLAFFKLLLQVMDLLRVNSISLKFEVVICNPLLEVFRSSFFDLRFLWRCILDSVSLSLVVEVL